MNSVKDYSYYDNYEDDDFIYKDYEDLFYNHNLKSNIDDLKKDDLKVETPEEKQQENKQQQDKHEVESEDIIEGTFVKYSQYNKDLLLQLEEARLKNDKLSQALDLAEVNLQRTKESLANIKKFNRKLEQDLELQIIYGKNLKKINLKFAKTINNLQSYRVYVFALLEKQNRTNVRIIKLIKTIKNLQKLIKHKNAIINKFDRIYNIVLKKAANVLKYPLFFSHFNNT